MAQEKTRTSKFQPKKKKRIHRAAVDKGNVAPAPCSGLDPVKMKKRGLCQWCNSGREGGLVTPGHGTTPS
eukprot:SAG31_NODE_14890_length_782_cov_0.822840_1_plen_69_part_10